MGEGAMQVVVSNNTCKDSRRLRLDHIQHVASGKGGIRLPAAEIGRYKYPGLKTCKKGLTKASPRASDKRQSLLPSHQTAGAFAYGK